MLNKYILTHQQPTCKKPILELCNIVLNLGSPNSSSIFVTLLYLRYPKKYFMHLV